MSIYSLNIIPEEIEKNFKPTRLYVKECAGIKYFGKSVKKSILNYTGSGHRWLNHVRKYGKENIKTVWVSEWFYCPKHLQEFALLFSEYNDIVNSDEWANIIPENGINGGGTAKQMRTKSAREKAEKTCLERYGVKHSILSPTIKEKAQNTYIDNYGSLGACLSTEQSISRRNFTNLERYGSACAANREGNLNSRKTQKGLNSRPEVYIIKRLLRIKRESLHKGWWYNSDEWLKSKIDELEKLPNPIIDTSNYNQSQLTRHHLINRANVQHLMDMKEILELKLGNNWFQRSDEWIDEQIRKFESEYQNTLLRTFDQLMPE